MDVESEWSDDQQLSTKHQSSNRPLLRPAVSPDQRDRQHTDARHDEMSRVPNATLLKNVAKQPEQAHTRQLATAAASFHVFPLIIQHDASRTKGTAYFRHNSWCWIWNLAFQRWSTALFWVLTTCYHYHLYLVTDSATRSPQVGTIQQPQQASSQPPAKSN